MLPTHKHTTPSGGYFPNHFPYFLMQESTHEWGGGGGGLEGLGKGHRGGGGHLPLGHEATDTWLPNAPVSQATGHCHAKFNLFLVSSIGGGGCTTPQGGMGEVGLWFG